MNLKPSTHASTDGFSAVEVLVAMTITSVFAAAALSIAFSSQGLLEADERRTTVNQNLRAGIDLLGIDIRQAGERLPGDAPAIQIMDGSSGAPDRLMLRRNQLDYVMPLCKNITAGSSADSIFVGKKKITGKVPPGCYPVPDANGDGWPDNLEAWRAYRIANGGSVLAYIHNPITGLGEFFTYDAEDNSTFHLHKANGANWQNDYLMNQEPRIYVLTVTEMLRQRGVVGKFVEFFGEGLSSLSLEDQATIANMAPEYGATCGFFPVDDDTLAYMKANFIYMISSN